MHPGYKSRAVLRYWVVSTLLSIGCIEEGSVGSATYVGGNTCVGCHQDESEAWRGSHHDLAMQVPSEETVLGDFSGVTFEYYGRSSTFFRRDGAFFVRTQGEDGELNDYRISYTFGASPLQQYLIQFPGGRLQALGVAWDARPRSEGGQRWFHLYPDGDVSPEHPLHWTGPEQRWNSRCAECHSTHLRKNYDPETDRYSTTWSDLDVSCEACHGPGSSHVDWARSSSRETDPEAGAVGLVVDLADRDGGVWALAPGARIAARTPARTARPELSVCAPCHSRRQLIAEEDPTGGSPFNTLRPALLDEGLYHSDGQIQGEVYVLGSFLQSAMYASGVTCSDCHDPHSARLRASGNALCSTCHTAEAYDAPAHHYHEQGSAGAQCVSCHMPEQTYMGIDPRRDHSIRVPRPDLSVTLGVPNACTQCHGDRPPQWAADAVARWYGGDRLPHYGELLARGRQGAPSAGRELAELATDPSQPGIVRATALDLLGAYPAPAAEVVGQALLDPDPLVRFGAVRASEAIPVEQRFGLVYRALEDSTKLVRTEAASVLASVPRALMPRLDLLDRVTSEYVDAQLIHADRPEAHLNLGILHAGRGDLEGAQRALENALRVDSTFVPAFVNLADLLGAQGREAEGERLLREAVDRSGGDGAARHALGLSLVRQGRTNEAITEFRAATLADPQNARFAYVYGVALHSGGQVEAAIEFLEETLGEHPFDLAILTALLSFNRDAGDLLEAIRYAEMWVDLAPDDPGAARELADLRARSGG